MISTLLRARSKSETHAFLVATAFVAAALTFSVQSNAGENAACPCTPGIPEAAELTRYNVDNGAQDTQCDTKPNHPGQNDITISANIEASCLPGGDGCAPTYVHAYFYPNEATGYCQIIYQGDGTGVLSLNPSQAMACITEINSSCRDQGF